MRRFSWCTRAIAAFIISLSLCTGALAQSSGGDRFDDPAASERIAYTHRPSGGAMMLDTFVVRPLMLGATVVGGATFLVSLPFSAMGGNVADARKILVEEPARYTFTRPLGQLEGRAGGR